MIKFFFSFILISVFSVCVAFQDEMKFERKAQLAFPNATLTTDHLGNIYVVAENILMRFDPQCKPSATYTEKSKGQLASLDASDPLKLVLFYPDFALIQLLNNQLAIQSEIQLRNINITQPLAVCASTENSFWVFDGSDFQLKKIDDNLKVINTSGELIQLLGFAPQPLQLQEKNGSVYLLMKDKGIAIFDRYGSYIQTLSFKNISAIQALDDDLLFSSEGNMFRYSLKQKLQSPLLKPDAEEVINFRMEQNQLYLLTADSLKVYSY